MTVTRAAAAVFILLAAFCVSAADAPYAWDQALWGTPSRIVRPEYPTAAAKAKLQGVVEVEGVIEGGTELSGIEYRPDTPGAEVFVTALRAVVPYWRFYVPMGDDCMPKPEKITTRIEFVIEGDEPKIFLSFPKRRATSPPKEKEGYNYKAVRVAEVTYPRRMLQAGVEALVYTRIEVAASGEVTEVAADAYARGVPKTTKIPELGTRLPGETLLGDFEKEARHTLMSWRYNPNPGDWKGCYTIVFRIKK